MDYQFLEDFKKLSIQCPPNHYKPRNMNVYRWVFDEISDENNFKPRWYILPDIELEKTDQIKDFVKRDTKICAMLSLSMFETEEDAKNRFDYFLDTQGRKSYKRFGTHISKGEITEDDGVNEEPNNIGHFNHHPVNGRKYEKTFVIISKL
jgi:hypothetical protein